MAGKHTGAYANGHTTKVDGFSWNPQNDRAYAEGREGNPASNPHVVGSEASNAYVAGAARKLSSADQFETAVE